jgi:hypothetical protein
MPDYLFSGIRDEYVFLKPNHVLPEFLMHVQIVKQPDSGGTSKMEGVNFDSLPKNMISLPHFDRDDKERQLRESSDKDNPSALASNRKLNDWLTQLNNALNNPNANTMTLVERSDPEPMAERLVRETGKNYCVILLFFYIFYFYKLLFIWVFHIVRGCNFQIEEQKR